MGIQTNQHLSRENKMSQKWLDAAKLYAAANKAKPQTKRKEKVGEKRERDKRIQAGVTLLTAFWKSSEADAARELLRRSEKRVVICSDSLTAITLDSGGFKRKMNFELIGVPKYKRIGYSEVIDSALESGAKLDEIIPTIRGILDRIADEAPSVKS